MQHPNSQRPTWGRGILLLLLLCGFALRLFEITRQDIWWDEARNIDVALRPFWQIPNAPELDIHPPVYFWLLHLWARIFSLSDGMGLNTTSLDTFFQLPFITRSLSAFAGVLGIALGSRLAGQWRSDSLHTPIIFAVLAAFSPYWFAESQETRMYTLSFLWLMAGAVLLTEATVVRRPGRLPLFALFSALALLTHYNSIFIILAWYGWWFTWALLQFRRMMWLRRVLGSALLMSILVLPVAPIALRQIPSYRNPNLTVPTISQYLSANWQTYFGGNAFSTDLIQVGDLFFGFGWIWGLLVLVSGGMAVQLWKGGKTTEQFSFYLAWLLGGLALYYVAVVDRGAFSPRYSSFVTPALYILTAVGISGWSHWNRVVPFTALVFVLMGFVPALAADIYDPRFAREDMRQTVVWLRENAGPNDVIFVDQKYPLGFYYQRFAIEERQQPTGKEAAPARYLFVDINTVDRRLTEWASHAKRIFWVQWFESDTDPRGAVRFLLDRAGQWEGRQTFRGYTVDWWTLDPPNHFRIAPEMTAATYIFPPAVETTELSLPAESLRAGDLLPIAIRWKRVTVGEIDRPLKARVALYPLGTNLLKAQDDRPLLNDRHLMPSEWHRDATTLNVYAIPLPDELSGNYEVRLLVYDAETLEPIPYVDLAGNPAGVEATIGTVTVKDGR